MSLDDSGFQSPEPPWPIRHDSPAKVAGLGPIGHLVLAVLAGIFCSPVVSAALGLAALSAGIATLQRVEVGPRGERARGHAVAGIVAGSLWVVVVVVGAVGYVAVVPDRP